METTEKIELNRFRRMSYDMLVQLCHLYKQLGSKNRESQCLKVLNEKRNMFSNFKMKEV